jgi:hypothetical protein
MTRTLTLLALLLPLSLSAAPGKDRSQLLERIERACQKNIRKEYKNHREICSCVSRNLGSGLDTPELELITRSHEEDPKAEELLQEEKYNDLILYDFEVTETCLENPAWTYGK